MVRRESHAQDPSPGSGQAQPRRARPAPPPHRWPYRQGRCRAPPFASGQVVNRLAVAVGAVVATLLGVRLLLLLERLLVDDHEVVRDLARSHVPEPVASVSLTAAGPDWMSWPERGEVDPTDEGLPSVLATERPAEPPWASWSEPLVEEPELG